jgi:bacteriocin biosynthesis cyclodehydratase domain-containing protein
MAVRSCSEEYKFGEEPARKAIRWLWESLDGEKRVADVLDTWMGSADLLSLIANLTERGMLEDNVGLERLSPEVRRRYAEQIIVFSHAHAGTPAPHASLRGSELQERLLGASVLVIGTGVLGSNVVRALCQIGIGSIGILGDGIVEQRLIERGAWYREHQAGEGCAHALIEQARSLRPDIEATFSQVRVQNEDAGSLPFDGVHLVVLAEDGFEPGRYAWVDQACHRSRVPWTSIRRNGWEVEIGPTIVPYQTGCFHCFEQRRAGAAGLSLQAGSREGRCFNLAIGPEWLALEALKLLTGFGECLTLGSAAILEPLSMRIGVHRVLRLPNCPRCSRELNSPPESPWLSK